MRTTLMLIIFALAAQAGGGCKDPPIIWTIYASYTDPATGLPMTPRITGDAVTTDASGNTIYAPGPTVWARLHVCGTHPSYDATLQVTKTRRFNVNLGLRLGNDYPYSPPTSAFYEESGLLNISDITWCQNHGFTDSTCTFYTAMTSAFTGPDGNTYHLRMEKPQSDVRVTSWRPDSTANCPYATSPVRVDFTPGALHPSKKDTYVVTPVLQGIKTDTGWTAPLPTEGCPVNASLPAATWPAAVSVLVQGTTGNDYNYGQYDTPFQFVIQNQ